MYMSLFLVCVRMCGCAVVCCRGAGVPLPPHMCIWTSSFSLIHPPHQPPPPSPQNRTWSSASGGRTRGSCTLCTTTAAPTRRWAARTRCSSRCWSTSRWRPPRRVVVGSILCTYMGERVYICVCVSILTPHHPLTSTGARPGGGAALVHPHAAQLLRVGHLLPLHHHQPARPAPLLGAQGRRERAHARRRAQALAGASCRHILRACGGLTPHSPTTLSPLPSPQNTNQCRWRARTSTCSSPC